MTVDEYDWNSDWNSYAGAAIAEGFCPHCKGRLGELTVEIMGYRPRKVAASGECAPCLSQYYLDHAGTLMVIQLGQRPAQT
jgi:hypothetical protein